MKTAFTPMEIWHNEPNLRAFLKRNHIIAEDENEKLTIPSFKCYIEKSAERGMQTETKTFPFYYQKMELMLEAMNGDFIQACDTFSLNSNSFICGKNADITVTKI